MTASGGSPETKPAEATAARARAFEPVVRRSHHLGEVPDVEIWNWAVRISVVGLFVIALGAVLNLLSHVVVPIILAWVVATILLPVVGWLIRRGVPRWLSALLVTFLVLLLLGLVVGVLSVPASYWIGRADELGALIRQKMDLVRHPLDVVTQFGRALSEAGPTPGTDVYVAPSETGIVRPILSVLTPIVDETVVFFIALIFNLIYQEEIQDGSIQFIRNPTYWEFARGILRDIEANMSRYFGTVALINVCLGLATTVVAAVIGYPQPYLWGVLAATLNFIPYLGPLLVMATFFLVGIVVSSSLGHALIGPAAFLALTTLEGQVITPTFVGHRLTINPFLVFMSVAFWTWMWGPVGAVLATPLLLSGMVVARHVRRPAAPPGAG